jgi:restriction system protein
LQAAVEFGDKTNEGQLIRAVAIPWFRIIKELERDPEFLFKFNWRTMEELIAAAYEQSGWEVILTPRSNDRGRDVIATRHDIGSIRIVDQVKRYSKGRRVSANDINAILGVLTKQPNVSKGIVTTTSEFAPGILKDKELKAFMPYRLELKDGEKLIKWLKNIASENQSKQ